MLIATDDRRPGQLPPRRRSVPPSHLRATRRLRWGAQTQQMMTPKVNQPILIGWLRGGQSLNRRRC